MITHVFKGYYKITYKHGSPVTTSPFRDIFFFFTVVPTPCPVNHLCIVQSLYHVSATFSTPTFLIIGISTVSLCFYFLFRLSLRLPPCLYTQHLSIEPLLRCLKYFFFIWEQTVKHSMPYRWTYSKEWPWIFQPWNHFIVLKRVVW